MCIILTGILAPIATKAAMNKESVKILAVNAAFLALAIIGGLAGLKLAFSAIGIIVKILVWIVSGVFSVLALVALITLVILAYRYVKDVILHKN
jgi:hypothetical protein